MFILAEKFKCQIYEGSLHVDIGTPIHNVFCFFYICLIFQALLTAKHYMEKSNAPYAFLVKRQTFAPYKLKKGPEPEEYVYLF